MQAPELPLRLVAPFGELNIPHMVTGGMAAIVYGEPRLTNDVDLVVRLAPGDAARLAAAYPEREFYVPPVEAIEQEARRELGGHFNLLHLESAMRADVYIAGTDALASWGLERRRRVPVGRAALWLAPIEYVIVKKLEYFKAAGSERHLGDVARMLRISGGLVDRQEVETWVERLGLRAEWDRAQA